MMPEEFVPFEEDEPIEGWTDDALVEQEAIYREIT